MVGHEKGTRVEIRMEKIIQEKARGQVGKKLVLTLLYFKCL